MSRRHRLVALLRAQLVQGITPGRLALTLGVGLALGIFPVLGTTTVLCLATGIAARLNQPLLQLVNYLVYPLQLALLIPFYRAGERLFGAAPVPLLSVGDLVQRFQAGPLQFVADYASVGLYGAAVWLLVSPLIVALAWLTLKRPLQSLARRLGHADAAGTAP